MVSNRAAVTRRRLMDAAEDLYGTHGIEAVSLRQIAAAAEQGNTSAVAYHFGSADALIDAILSDGHHRVNERRRQRLEALLVDQPERPELGRIVEVMVRPPFDLLASGSDWLRYYRFFNRFTRWPGSPRFTDAMWRYNESFSDVRSLLMLHLVDLPDDIRRLRWRMAANQLVDTVTRLADTPDPSPAEIEEQAACLVDMTTAGLLAPVSGCPR